MIKKEVYLTSIVVDEIVKIIEDSGIMTLEKDNAGNYWCPNLDFCLDFRVFLIIL